MKKIYLIFFASLFSFGVIAKTTSVSSPNVFPHFTSQGITPSTGSGNIRIIGQTYLTFDGNLFQPFDSISYSYSAGRGGLLAKDDLTDRDVNFDESITYVYDNFTNSYYNRLRRLQTFNSNNRSQIYTCESWRQSTAGPFSYWKDSCRYKYIYDGSGSRVDSTSFQLWYDGNIWAPHVFYKNVFDANNNVVEMNSNVYKIAFVYDANNNLVQRTDSHKDPYTSPWSYFQRMNFTYDANGNLDYYIVQKWDGAWINETKFIYNYAGQDVESINEMTWDSGAWTNSGINSFTYDNHHNKLTDVWQAWNSSTGSFENTSRSRWTYNSSDQPVVFITDTWEQSTSSWQFTTDDFQLRYYYETYSPTSVHNMSAAKVDVNLYPVPAQNELTLEMKWEKAQPYSLSIYDMQGKLIRTSEQNASSFVQKKIPVSDFPSGNYFIRISGEDGQLTEKFSVIH